MDAQSPVSSDPAKGLLAMSRHDLGLGVLTRWLSTSALHDSKQEYTYGVARSTGGL